MSTIIGLPNRSKRIFVCSPLRARDGRTVAQHVALAKRLCHSVSLLGHAPFAPHLLYTQFLDDQIEQERDAGIRAGLLFLDVCHELWVFDGYGVAGGMRFEIEHARKNGKPVVYPPSWKEIQAARVG